jgi:hypothetical protein
MVFLVDEGIVGNAGHFAANTLGGSDSQVEVLLDLVDVHVLLHVDSPHVDGVLLDQIDKLAEDDAVGKDEEEIVVVNSHGQVLRNVGVAFKVVVESSGEDLLLLDQVGMREAAIVHVLVHVAGFRGHD